MNMNDPGFQVLYENGPCLAVNKPAGLSTQAPPGIDCLEARIKNFLKGRGHPYDFVYLGVPHRLDRPASGTIVFCTKRRAAHKLAKQFENREVNKIYWACVEGKVEPESGAWEDYLRKAPDQARAEVVAPMRPKPGRPCCIIELWASPRGDRGWKFAWKPVACTRSASRLPRAAIPCWAMPNTAPQQPLARSTKTGACAIALHARLLEFKHPMTKEMVSITAPVDENWQKTACGFA